MLMFVYFSVLQLQLWDTAGQERFRKSMVSALYILYMYILYFIPIENTRQDVVGYQFFLIFISIRP